ncbi:MAG: 1,4-dihydroxy-6-naphthoate synthase [Pedobacter sp.]|nr:MAG: 1,4-dihydroxy-6-naphthoate synthase [Pedobacter sp.]
MKLSLGFSPCPNDTFIFDALIHGKIDTEGLQFEVFYEDVETLNQAALNSQLDITKLSYHAYTTVLNNYILLNAGSALGFGVGPLLICDKNRFSEIQNVILENPSSLKVGIPGTLTTANFLLQIAYPHLIQKKEILFSDIEQALLDGDIDVGLIIHENRFTYQQKGLQKIQDLGEYWETETKSAIPLGGIVMKRDLGKELQGKVNRLIRKSVEFAFANPTSSLNFIKKHAQSMEEEVIYKHIELYVNKYSIDLGPVGKNAITQLFEKAVLVGAIPQPSKELFL